MTLPRPRYLTADHVVDEMARFGTHRLRRLGWGQWFVLAVIGGVFIAAGALFSILLSAGALEGGGRHLLAGLGFSTGFFFVVLSEAALFTEANVVLPAVLLSGDGRPSIGRIAAFWLVVFAGNLAGAWAFGQAVHLAHAIGPDALAGLREVIDAKTAYAREGTAAAWARALLSGILANAFVGMAAFFATMGRTIVGKYVPVFLAVTFFVAAGLQHSPANMGYFGLATPAGLGPGWGTALGWSIVPAGLGNMIGGAFLVAVPFWYAFRPNPGPGASPGRAEEGQ